MEQKHRVIKKNFEAEITVNEQKLPLNHMMQETISNIMVGFAKTLKGTDEKVERIELQIQRLHQPVDADAHTYP